jgi:hypothetical protein
MHIIIKDPVSGEESTMCVERKSQTCFILASEIENLNALVGIARAQKVNEVRLVVPSAAVEELLSLGWKVSATEVLLVKGAKDGA